MTTAQRAFIERRALHPPIVSSSDMIVVRLSDGTSLRVQAEELRQIDEAL